VGDVFVEIVAKQKGCMLCDLAIGILEEIAPEFAPEALRWEVVDVGSRQGLVHVEELARCCGRRPAVPSIVINGKIAFDHIPEMQALTEVVRTAIEMKCAQGESQTPTNQRRMHAGWAT